MRERGCHKPGYSYPARRMYYFTSPMLAEADRTLRECPVGAILRDAPHTLDVIRSSRYADGAGLEFLRAPRYFQHAVGVINSERERLADMREKAESAKRDAQHGARVLRGG